MMLLPFLILLMCDGIPSVEDKKLDDGRGFW